MGNVANTAGRVALGVGTGGLSETGFGKKLLGGGGGGGGSFSYQNMPAAPQFQSLRDQKSGLLSNPNLRANAGPDLQLNTQGLDAIRGRALGTGPSAWAKLAQQKNATELAGQRSNAAANSAAAQSQARSQLASRGGLMGGAAERLANSSGQNLMNQRQNIANQGSLNNLNIGMQDEAQRTDLLKGLPGMEVQALQPQMFNKQTNLDTQKYNIGNALQDKYAEDQAKQTAYGQQMQSWAAQNQANAIMGAGGGKKG